MGLENLKSVFAEGVGNDSTLPSGRHTGEAGYSTLDNIVGLFPTPVKPLPILNEIFQTPIKPIAEGIMSFQSQIANRHGGHLGPNEPPLNPSHSQPDNFGGDYSPILDRNSSRLINIRNGTDEIPFKGLYFNFSSSPAFPENYTSVNTIIADKFEGKAGKKLKDHSWADLYLSDHKSRTDIAPDPNNPYSPFSYGNPNVTSALSIRKNMGKHPNGKPRESLIGGDTGEPYVISKLPTTSSSFTSTGRFTNAGYRIFPAPRALTDLERVSQYLTSPAGILNIALKNTNMIVNSNVVRKGDELIKVPQRFNKGYNPAATLLATSARVMGVAMPNFLIKSGFPPGILNGSNYGDLNGIMGGLIRGDKPEYHLNTTFTKHEPSGGGFLGFKKYLTSAIPFAGKVDKTSSGDKMTLAAMIQGKSLSTSDGETESQDETGLREDFIKLNIDDKKNGMPLYFKDLRDDTYIFFRAFLEGITEEIAPSWAEHNYMGRSEPTYNYERTTRSISFTLKMYAQTRLELSAIYAKINRLTSLCYPQYHIDEYLVVKESSGTKQANLRMKPPLTKFRLGEMFGKTNKEMLGFIESLSYVTPEETTWETENGARVPKHITATVTYRVIHGKVPALNNITTDPFYGYVGADKGY